MASGVAVQWRLFAPAGAVFCGESDSRGGDDIAGQINNVGVAVGGTGVSVGCGVAVGGTGVLLGDGDSVGGTGVAVGGNRVTVGTGLLVGVNVTVGEGVIVGEEVGFGVKASVGEGGTTVKLTGVIDVDGGVTVSPTGVGDGGITKGSVTARKRFSLPVPSSGSIVLFVCIILSLDSLRTCLIWSKVSEGLADKRRDTAPATCGVDILVPDRYTYLPFVEKSL